MHYAQATQACDSDVELEHVNSQTKELVIHTKLKRGKTCFMTSLQMDTGC